LCIPATGAPRCGRLPPSQDRPYTRYPTKSLGYARHPLTHTTALPRPSFHGTGALSFSTKGEYGVRLMVQLARHYGTGPASLAGIAAEEDLPRAYLEQLVVNLRAAGLVTSTRGAHGGYELARPPDTIPMSEVLRALEGPIAPMICASDDPEHATTCDRSSRCTVNVLWVRVRDAITGALDSMTLADLAPQRLVALDGPVVDPQPTPDLEGALTS
jgi:Rrf2 family cysteine metabolism transcriptional repressor